MRFFWHILRNLLIPAVQKVAIIMSQFLDRSGAGSDCIDNEMKPVSQYPRSVVKFFADNKCGENTQRLVMSGYIALRSGF